MTTPPPCAFPTVQSFHGSSALDISSKCRCRRFHTTKEVFELEAVSQKLQHARSTPFLVQVVKACEAERTGSPPPPPPPRPHTHNFLMPVPSTTALCGFISYSQSSIHSQVSSRSLQLPHCRSRVLHKLGEHCGGHHTNTYPERLPSVKIYHVFV